MGVGKEQNVLARLSRVTGYPGLSFISFHVSSNSQRKHRKNVQDENEEDDRIKTEARTYACIFILAED